MMNDHIIAQLDSILQQRKNESADASYVASLYAKGTEKILKKVAEESAEVIMAAKDLDQVNNNQNQQHLIYEVTDLWFHSLVLLQHHNLAGQAVLEELARRFGMSGHVEKSQRTQA